MINGKTVQVMHGDLEPLFFDNALAGGEAAFDIETSGLDWSLDRIGTCQVATRREIAVVILDGGVPERLRALLEAPDVRKVFHHAPFDLRFMTYQWKAHAANVACTKIASKVLQPELETSEHSLMPLLARHLDVTISKDAQRSDWLQAELAPEQVDYAATDVAHLLELLDALLRKCAWAGATALVEESYRYLPTRVQLDIRGAGDVFVY